MEATLSSTNAVRWANTLAIFTIVYNLVEGAVALAFGVSEHSVALLGFGLDSLIEVGSAGVVLWRFRGERSGRTRERDATAARVIGALFLGLAAVTIVGAGFRLSDRVAPDTALPGLVISSLSLSFMFALWAAKRRVGTTLNSATVLADARCSLACIKLSVVLLAGSLLYLVAPELWWADSVAALVLAGLIGREGLELVRKEPDCDTGCC